MKKVALVFSVVAVSSLSGCASMMNTGQTDKFGCTGMPHGSICKTPVEVYQDTNGSLNAYSKRAAQASVSEEQKGQAKRPDDDDKALALVEKKHPVLQKVTGAPTPVREPAKVMRIWIAPWTDKNDALHWPSYVYVEVEPRKWAFGTQRQNWRGMRMGIPLMKHASPAEVPSLPEKTGAEQGALAPKQNGESFFPDYEE